VSKRKEFCYTVHETTKSVLRYNGKVTIAHPSSKERRDDYFPVAFIGAFYLNPFSDADAAPNMAEV